MAGVTCDAPFFRPGAELAGANLKNFLEKVLDFWGGVWYTIIVKREAVSSQRSGKLMAPMGDCVETGPPFQLILAESSPKGIKKVEKTS